MLPNGTELTGDFFPLTVKTDRGQISLQINDEFTLFLTLLFGKDHSDIIYWAQHGTANAVHIRQFDGAYGVAVDTHRVIRGGPATVDSIISQKRSDKALTKYDGGRLFRSALIPLLLVLGVFGVLGFSLYLIRLYQDKTKHHVPMASKDLSGPGQSTLKLIEQVNKDLQGCHIFLFLMPILLFATHLSYSYFGNVSESWIRTAISLGGGLSLLACYFIKLIRLRSKRALLRLGYEGEVAVARELGEMMSKGYQVYHDFPGDGFHIDHILIGPIGVMAVETKTFKGTARSGRKAEAVVTYDGRMLHFPKYSDYQSIDQAKRQAAWLSQWLSHGVGQDICARAMVAVPGWSVKRTSSDGIPVVNPKQFETLFKHITPRPLTESMIQRIVQQVERQCREAADPQGNSCYSLSP